MMGAPEVTNELCLYQAVPSSSFSPLSAYNTRVWPRTAYVSILHYVLQQKKVAGCFNMFRPVASIVLLKVRGQINYILFYILYSILFYFVNRLLGLQKDLFKVGNYYCHCFSGFILG